MLGEIARRAGTAKVFRRSLLWSIIVLVAGLVASCIISGDRCDANQVHIKQDQADYCACAAGSIPDPQGFGCIRCGEHEIVKDAKCVCDNGYAKATPSSSCETSEGPPIGTSCTDASSCSGTYPYCAADGDDQYCTLQDCGTNDCPSGYTCETISGSTFCAKLPTGIGETCSSSADCASFDAADCDTFNKVCVLGSCATGQLECPNTWRCCDLSMFAPGVSFCTPADGMCPGKVVTP